eukprot:TRINITY_DN10500_c4_g2_i1.p1 TRINITY_DN10500_c4_g2~~TRINITY_DN10500_c4_g2_i1.p1  ORF type:complete len:346 (+),score=71.42 TRINITY_DN10500_c4_g2_i1:166-1203(+)
MVSTFLVVTIEHDGKSVRLTSKPDYDNMTSSGTGWMDEYEAVIRQDSGGYTYGFEFRDFFSAEHNTGLYYQDFATKDSPKYCNDTSLFNDLRRQTFSTLDPSCQERCEDDPDCRFFMETVKPDVLSSVFVDSPNCRTTASCDDVRDGISWEQIKSENPVSATSGYYDNQCLYALERYYGSNIPYYERQTCWVSGSSPTEESYWEEAASNGTLYKMGGNGYNGVKELLMKTRRHSPHEGLYQFKGMPVGTFTVKVELWTVDGSTVVPFSGDFSVDVMIEVAGITDLVRKAKMSETSEAAQAIGRVRDDELAAICQKLNPETSIELIAVGMEALKLTGGAAGVSTWI